MRRANTVLALILASVFSLALSQTVFAAAAIRPEDKECPPHERKMDKVFGDLGLSQEQKDQIREFHKVNRDKTRALFDLQREKRRQLGEELDKQNSDTRRIKVLTEELKDVEGRLIEQRVQSAMELKQILTPQQYEKFNDSVKKFHRDDKGRKGGPGHRKGPMNE
jgi:Spy/CpxP family protein refolding chaperone